MRNDNARVIRDGESFILTRRGVPVARLIPISSSDLRCARPARLRIRFADLPRATSSLRTSEVLDEGRSER